MRSTLFFRVRYLICFSMCNITLLSAFKSLKLCSLCPVSFKRVPIVNDGASTCMSLATRRATTRRNKSVPSFRQPPPSHSCIRLRLNLHNGGQSRGLPSVVRIPLCSRYNLGPRQLHPLNFPGSWSVLFQDEIPPLRLLYLAAMARNRRILHYYHQSQTC